MPSGSRKRPLTAIECSIRAGGVASSTPSRSPRPRKKSVSSVDIARHLGISVQTVLFALGYGGSSTTRVSEETAARVRALAKKWRYRPSASARAMRGKLTRQVGFITEYNYEDWRPPLLGIAGMLGASDYLAPFDWHVNVIQDPGGRDPVVHLPRYLREHLVDGMIVNAGSPVKDREIIEDLKKFNIPYVLLNGEGEYNSVVLDDLFGTGAATQHLIELGHERIFYVSFAATEFDHHSRRARERGYSDAMARAGLAPHIWNLETDAFEPSRAEAVREDISQRRRRSMYEELYLRMKPTALVCYSDIEALQAIQILLKKGVRVPEQISVVGYNDIYYLSSTYPPLTTLRINFYRMGQLAAEMLMKLIKEPGRRIPSGLVRPQLIVRESTAPPPRR